MMEVPGGRTWWKTGQVNTLQESLGWTIHQRQMLCLHNWRPGKLRPPWLHRVQCLACRDSGPATWPEEEEEGEGRPGQGQVGVPCLALYHGESGYSA